MDSPSASDSRSDSSSPVGLPSSLFDLASFFNPSTPEVQEKNDVVELTEPMANLGSLSTPKGSGQSIALPTFEIVWPKGISIIDKDSSVADSFQWLLDDIEAFKSMPEKTDQENWRHQLDSGHPRQVKREIEEYAKKISEKEEEEEEDPDDLEPLDLTKDSFLMNLGIEKLLNGCE